MSFLYGSATNDWLVKTYQQLNSVHKVAKVIGWDHSTVHKRLTQLGVINKMRVLTTPEKQLIKELYVAGFQSGDGKLEALSQQINRTISFISRFAKTQGLTSYRRSKDAALVQEHIERTKLRIATQGHPKGFLGGEHSLAGREKMGAASKKMWASLTEEQRSELTKKQLIAKLKKYGTLVPHNRTLVSWKSAWRTIGGRKIFFRSRWEYNYCVYLHELWKDKKIANWEHEPKTFWFEGIKRGCLSYLPDFRITNLDGSQEYHEVKGWMDARSKTKIRRMAKYFPDVKLVVITGAWFKENKHLESLPAWERNY